MAMKLQIDIVGLCAYVTGAQALAATSRVTVLLLDPRHSGVTLPPHSPRLSMPLSQVDDTEGSPPSRPPDEVIQLFTGERHAVWNLERTSLEVLAGGRPLELLGLGSPDAGRAGRPDHLSLGWIPDLERAAGSGFGRIASDCMSPRGPSLLVASRIAFTEGGMQSIIGPTFSNSTWRFEAKNGRVANPRYVQALADGARLTVQAERRPVALRLTGLDGEALPTEIRLAAGQGGSEPNLSLAIANLPAAASSSLLHHGSVDHFAALYDLSERGRSLGPDDRPVPVDVQTAAGAEGGMVPRTSRTVFCPGGLMYEP